MKRLLLALALFLLAAALMLWAIRPLQPGRVALSGISAVVATAAAILLASGALVLLTGAVRNSKSRALVRLDHFLPFLKRKKKRETLLADGWLVCAAKKVFPAALFDDQLTGKPGYLRRALKRLGPSVVSSPLRRVVQAVCLAIFLTLFFYVLWPYQAIPAPVGRISANWQLDRIDGETGSLHFLSENAADWLRDSNQVHLIDERALDAIRGDFGAFLVTESQVGKVTLAPVTQPTDEQLDALFTSSGSWALHERSPWPSHYTDELAAKEWIPADAFLVIDPLVSLSTAVASRSWVWSLASAGMILVVCVLIPRGFCGYLCPLGTLIDVFDWAIGKQVTRFRVTRDGWWVHIKYYLLAGTMVCAIGGVLVSGFVAAIPVVTRGMLFLGDPLQSGVLRGWQHLPPWNAGHCLSILLFLAVLGLGLFKPRFWCKYVCPSGAVFSLGNLLRATERKVEESCIHCNKCVEICPFDAIKPDFTTRTTDCTLCQTCAGVCPTHAIKFVERWNVVELKTVNDPLTHETVLGRRGFMSLAAGTAAAVAGGVGMTVATKMFGAKPGTSDVPLPIRPPGSVPEQEFLQMCIRCGECYKVCPFNVLQPLGFEQGLEGLWTPHVVADHAGCAPSCNACGQVCPTGAIRELLLEEKKVARMGLAIVNEVTCLPHANREACQLCVDECTAAGYHAMEFRQVHTALDTQGLPVEGSGYLAPVVLADKCVGCGLCQMSCHRVNVEQQGLLDISAIIVTAGEGNEDRTSQGSYRQLRRNEALKRRNLLEPNSTEYFVPESPTPENPLGTSPIEDDPDSDSPFGSGIQSESSAEPAKDNSNPFGLPE